MNARTSWSDKFTPARVASGAKRLSAVGVGMLAGGLIFSEGDNQQAFVTLGAIELALAAILYVWARFRR